MHKTDVNTEDSKKQTARELAGNVLEKVGYLESLFDLMHDQGDYITRGDVDGRLRTQGNLATLLNCADRFLAELKEACTIALAGGAQ